MSTPEPQTDDTKRHGDKLERAAGVSKRPAEEPMIAPSEPPLKVHGDKLRDAVDKAKG